MAPDVEEKVEEPKEEKKTGSKKGIVVLGIVLAIIAGLVIGWKYLTSAESQNTTIKVDSGSVEVNGQKAKTGQVLTNGDSIKTLPASFATISFPGGTEIRLDENTEIKINSQGEDISVFQSVGRTWSRVINLLGVVNYEVESSNLIASVRGTAFSTEVTEEGTNVDVDEGEIETSNDGSKALVEEGQGASAGKGRREIVKRAIRQELKESEWFKKNQELDVKLLERIRKRASSPRQFLSALREISSEDIAKFRRLAERSASGQITLTPAQESQLDNLDVTSPDGVARALYIIDPQEFSDVAHWSRVLRILFPLIQRFGVEKVIK